jgi:hypothetical protein
VSIAIAARIRARLRDADSTLLHRPRSVSLTIFGLRHNAAANLSLVLLRPDGTSAHLLNGNCFGLSLGATSNVAPPTGPYSFAPFDGQARALARPAPTRRAAHAPDACCSQDFTFTDGAPSTLAATCRSNPVAGGSYLPASSVAGSAAAGDLSTLAGASSAGVWQLRVENKGAGGACGLGHAPVV